MVKSWDIFDTLIFRALQDPISIFQIMEAEFGIKDFMTVRKSLEFKHDGNWDRIYGSEMAKMLNISYEDLAALCSRELELEMEHCHPIVENMSSVRDGDILISDMYLPKEFIMRMLVEKGRLAKRVKVYVSYEGKRKGTVWDLVKQCNIIIDSHKGDSMETDVSSPRAHGVVGQLCTLTKMTTSEDHWKASVPSLAYCMRFCRLLNPYNYDVASSSSCHQVYEHATRFIPFWIGFCHHIRACASKTQKTRILFTTRDSMYLYFIFKALFKDDEQLECDVLYSSRYALDRGRDGDDDGDEDDVYATYIKKKFDGDGPIIVVDVQGTGRTLSACLAKLKIVRARERVTILLGEHNDYEYQRDPAYHQTLLGIKSYFHGNELNDQLERMNMVPFGTFVGMDLCRPLFAPLEYNKDEWAVPIQKCVLNVLEFIKRFGIGNSDLPGSKVLSYLKTCWECPIPKAVHQIVHTKWIKDNLPMRAQAHAQAQAYNEFMFHMDMKSGSTLTNLANTFQSDKGTVAFHKHGYTQIYDQLFDSIRYKDVRIFEIGLSVYGTDVYPSLQMWINYFPFARIVGADIREFNIAGRVCDRARFLQLDQSDLVSLRRVADSEPCVDVLIDDGSHASYDQQITFNELFSLVIPGGLYIIEDLHYQPDADHYEPKTRDVFANWEKKNFVNPHGVFTNLEKIKGTIESITFYPSRSPFFPSHVLQNALCVVRKKVSYEFLEQVAIC